MLCALPQYKQAPIPTEDRHRNDLRISEGTEISNRERNRPAFDRIGRDGKTQLKQQNTETQEPTTIICIDEARGLLNYHNSENSPFRSFRRAIAQRWKGPRAGRDWYNPGRDYFELLLDTTQTSHHPPTRMLALSRGFHSNLARSCSLQFMPLTRWTSILNRIRSTSPTASSRC